MAVIEFKVGDTLVVCASIDIFCGTFYVYSMYNINISKYPDACTITIGDPSHNCLPHNGIEIEFTFKNYGTVLKSLGRITTNTNGVASITYQITEEDATLFNNNPGFKVAACFTATGPNFPNPTSGSYCRDTSNLLIRGKYIGNACITKQSTSVCLNDKTLIIYENPVYIDGAITEACVYRAGSSAILPEGKIKIFRLTDITWTLVGESTFLPIQNSGITTFSGLNIPVRKGDYIGLYVRPSVYDACIDSKGGVGLLYAKTHTGDVIGTSHDSEWTNIDNYRVAITATVVPCSGVTCPNICVGYNLYSQICDPNLGCIQGPLIQSNSPDCGYVPPGVEKHYLYFQVSTLFPANYIIDKMSHVYTAATNAILDYITDYYIESVLFDTNTYIMTIAITKRQTLGSPRIQSLIPPIFIVLAVIAVAIISAIMVWYAFWYMGSESVTGVPPSTRTIKVTPTTSAIQTIKPTFPIVIEYNEGKTPKTLEITDGNPKTFSVPTNVDVVVTVKAKDNPYYKITKRTIPACSPQSEDPCAKTCAPECEIVAVFSPVEDGTLNPTAKDSQGNPITCGFYEVYEQDSQGSLTLIKRQALASDGKVDPTKVIADVNQCVYIVPCDLNTYRPQMKCYKISAGQTETGDITVNRCSETKNQVSVRTVYIAADGTRQPFTAERIDVKLGTTIITTKVPTSDITLLPGLEKNTTYSVFVTKANYSMINNGQAISFGNTDCDIKDVIMEANPPPNSYDIAVEVRSAATASIIQGASIILDTRAPQTTGASGTSLFTAIPTGSHHFKITYTGYKDLEFDYNVTTSETILRSLQIDQVFADADTRIVDFAPSTGLYADSMVSFKGDLEFLEGTTWNRLRDATINISVKKIPTNEEIKTFTAITSPGSIIPPVAAGYFETTDWLIPKDLANTDINVRADFVGVGRYKPSFYETTYHIGEECAVKNPITGECIVSQPAGYGFMLLAGLGLLLGITLFRPGGAAEVIVRPPETKALPPPRE